MPGREHQMRNILIAFLTLTLIGCATTWQPSSGLYRSESGGFTANLPTGWVLERKNTNITYVRKEGTPIGIITIEKISLQEKAGAEKKKITKGMLPHELIEALIDETRKTPGISDVKIVEISPAKIADLDGTKAVYTFRRKNNLLMKSIVYGLLTGDYCYKIVLIAPQRHYFEFYSDDFEKVISSFKLVKS
jgi:hypothetical protein